jgi:hypothetical protein
VFGIGALAIAAMGEQMQRARASLRLRAEHAEERARLAAEREAALVEARRTASLLQSIMDYVPEGITVAWGPEANIDLVSRHGLRSFKKMRLKSPGFLPHNTRRHGRSIPSMASSS